MKQNLSEHAHDKGSIEQPEALPSVGLTAVNKNFGPTRAVQDASLTVPNGSFFTLIGPSGCGKTTILRLIGGLETPDSGIIQIDGNDVSNMPANRRPTHTVFQSIALFPHMSVAENISYGLKIDRVPKSEIGDRVHRILQRVHLPGYEDRMPDTLSGGQRQRVAIARALVKEPRILLLDEPMSSLDAKLRENLRLELIRLQKEIGITFIMVTHDQEEALAMSDQVAIINDGVIQQVSTPNELYEAPRNRFVAGFIGSMTIFPAHLMPRERDEFMKIEMTKVTQGPAAVKDSTTSYLGIRPEKVVVSLREPLDEAPESQSRLVKLSGLITRILYGGNENLIYVEAMGHEILVRVTNKHRDSNLGLESGVHAWCSWQASDMMFFLD